MSDASLSNRFDKSDRETMPGKKRVLIVDDHPAVRESLAGWIDRSSDLVVCGEAADIPEAMRAFDECRPDVAVVDISLKGDSGIDLVKRIRAKDPTVRILVWSMHPDSLYAERALNAGALGYLNKEHATSKILDAIHAILNDELYVSPEVAHRLMTRSVGKKLKSQSAIDLLSDRELQVFELLGKGKDTRAIASQLRLSVHTIETHRQRIKHKLDIAGSNELIRRASQWVLEQS